MLEYWQQLTGISFWAAWGLAAMAGVLLGVWRFALTAEIH
jgi:cbb3-type cytochrome oxidase subunit 3